MPTSGKTLFAALGLAGSTMLAAAADWQPLFNGRDLTGWERHSGTAEYRVEDGVIVGRTVAGSPNTFLCTTREYGDFELEFEFNVPAGMNSGVQFRSQWFTNAIEVAVKGAPKKIPADRVHGYQYEIDPSPRSYTGGVYDEARRAWLADLKTNDAARAAFRTNDWNQARIECQGDHIRTWINGVLATDFRDDWTLRGIIALQVHSIPKTDVPGKEVRWRNLRLRELPAAAASGAPANTLSEAERAAGWRLLWDGKSTAGWRSAKGEAFPQQGWEIKDGALTVQASGGGESAAGGDIVTRERFSQFDLMLDFKITAGANSGIKYFCQPNLDPITGTGAKAATGSAIGLEFQILDDERHPDAKAGRAGNRTIGSLYDLMTAAPTKHASPIGEWNTARVTVVGNQVEHWLNGQKVVSYERGSAAFREAVAQSKYKNIPGFGEWADGHILLQDHGNQVSFRNIKLRIPARH
jgi:hypothetical protein